MNLTDLSDRELLVMKCLWDAAAPMTVGDLIEKIQQTYGISYKETTVYTFLKRLKDKNYVTSYKKGSSHFSPTVSETDYLEQYAKTMAKFWGKASSTCFLQAYTTNIKFTAKEWDAIRKSGK